MLYSYISAPGVYLAHGNTVWLSDLRSLSDRMDFLAVVHRGAVHDRQRVEKHVRISFDSIHKNACFTFPVHVVIANDVIIDQERVLGD